MTGLGLWWARGQRAVGAAEIASDVGRGAGHLIRGVRGLAQHDNARWRHLERRRRDDAAPAVAGREASWGEDPRGGRALIAGATGVWTLGRMILYTGLAIGGFVVVRRGVRDLRAHLQDPVNHP